MTRFMVIVAAAVVAGLSAAALAGPHQFAGGRAAPQWVNRSQATQHYALSGVTRTVRAEPSPAVAKLTTKGNFRIAR